MRGMIVVNVSKHDVMYTFLIQTNGWNDAVFMLF